MARNRQSSHGDSYCVVYSRAKRANAIHSSPISAITSASLSFTCLHVQPVAPVTMRFHSLIQFPIYPSLI